MMEDYNMTMSLTNISNLKETLQAQQQLLQRLYTELDAEREASASAASEALSVILRLQGEKAAIKMESEHYKRLAEEKMCHAEESLDIIEDIIYQKEMEVSFLNYQIQAYRHKLLSMGCVEPGIGEIEYPKNLFQRNEADKLIHTIGRRNSAPGTLKAKKFMTERESSIDEKENDEEINEWVPELGKKTDNSNPGSINSYWEQIKKLDERVQEIAGASYTRSPSSVSSNLRNETRSPSPQFNIGGQFDSKKVTVMNGIDQIKTSSNMLKDVADVDNPCSPNVYDVFEVPQVGQKFESHESVTKGKKDENFERDNVVHPEAVKYAKDEHEWLKKLLPQVGQKFESHESVNKGKKDENIERDNVVHPEAVKHAKNEPEWLKKLLQQVHCDSNKCKQSDWRLTVSQASTSGSASQPGFHRLNQASEIVEVERSGEASREEELKLLNEIKEQINFLHDDIRDWKVKKSTVKYETSLRSLSEAMLHFWL